MDPEEEEGKKNKPITAKGIVYCHSIIYSF